MSSNATAVRLTRSGRAGACLPTLLPSASPARAVLVLPLHLAAACTPLRCPPCHLPPPPTAPPLAAMMNVNANGEGEDNTGVSEEVGIKIPCVSPHGRMMDNPRDESQACRDRIAAVNGVYRFDGEHVTLGGTKMSNTQFDGAVVLPPIISDGRETAGNFRVRNPSNGRLLLAHPSHALTRQYIESCEAHDLRLQAFRKLDHLVDIYFKCRTGSRGMINLGYATEAQAANGWYLQRFGIKPEVTRGGIRVPKVKSDAPKELTEGEGREMLHAVARTMEQVLHIHIENDRDLDARLDQWPTVKDERQAILKTYKYLNEMPPPEPFPGLMHQFTTLGDGKVTMFHFDNSNAGMSCGKGCDSHLCLTNNPGTLFVIHCVDEDDNVQPYCFRQYKHALTLFRAANCLHGAVDEKTYLSYLSQLGLGGHYKYIVANKSNDRNDGNLEEESVKRVIFTTYSRRSLSDHAWELRLWEESQYEPFYKHARSKYSSIQRPKQSAEEANRVRSIHGLVSPF